MEGSLTPIVVVPAPGGPADLADRCRAWADELGVTVEVREPVPPEGLAELLSAAAGSRASGVVVGVPGEWSEDLRDVVGRLRVPVVWVARDRLEGPSPPGGRLIHGRGTSGYRWALAHLDARLRSSASTMSYGDHPAQVGDLRRGGRNGTPLVALVHGGFWRDEWERDLMDPLAAALAGCGYTTWNLEYRRVGATGGGWPASADDVAAGLVALQQLPFEAPIGPIAVVGHSAGAQLAITALARWDRTPTLFVGLAGLYDLRAAAADGVGWGSVEAFLGGDPDAAPEAYEAASPVAALPLGIRHILIHGAADEHVPPDQSRRQADAAADAGDDVELVEVDGADHFDVITPHGPAWEELLGALPPLPPAG